MPYAPYRQGDPGRLRQDQNTTGRHEAWGDVFDPKDFYDYRSDPAGAVPALLRKFTGRRHETG